MSADDVAEVDQPACCGCLWFATSTSSTRRGAGKRAEARASRLSDGDAQRIEIKDAEVVSADMLSGSQTQQGPGADEASAVAGEHPMEAASAEGSAAQATAAEAATVAAFVDVPLDDAEETSGSEAGDDEDDDDEEEEVGEIATQDNTHSDRRTKTQTNRPPSLSITSATVPKDAAEPVSCDGSVSCGLAEEGPVSPTRDLYAFWEEHIFPELSRSAKRFEAPAPAASEAPEAGGLLELAQATTYQHDSAETCGRVLGSESGRNSLSPLGDSCARAPKPSEELGAGQELGQSIDQAIEHGRELGLSDDEAVEHGLAGEGEMEESKSDDEGERECDGLARGRLAKETDDLRRPSTPGPCMEDGAFGSSIDGGVSGNGMRWMEIKDSRTGRFYYYDTLTKSSMWVKPAGFEEERALAASKEREKGEGADWVEAVDEHGRTYYYDKHTLRSRWDRPSSLGEETGPLKIQIRKPDLYLDVAAAQAASEESKSPSGEHKSPRFGSPRASRAGKLALSMVQTAGTTALQTAGATARSASSRTKSSIQSIGAICASGKNANRGAAKNAGP